MTFSEKVVQCHICKGPLEKKNLGNCKVNFCPKCGAIEPLNDWVSKIKASAH